MPENALFQTVSETGTIIGMYAAIGVAISRHRLYDIDILINRTLVYTSLTVSLAAVVSTLAIAAHFNR